MNPTFKPLADIIKKRKAARLAAAKFPPKPWHSPFKRPGEQAIAEDAGNEAAPTEAAPANDAECPAVPGVPETESVEAPAEAESVEAPVEEKADVTENIQGDASPVKIESEIPASVPTNGSAPEAETKAKPKKKYRKKGKAAETVAEVAEESV